MVVILVSTIHVMNCINTCFEKNQHCLPDMNDLNFEIIAVSDIGDQSSKLCPVCRIIRKLNKTQSKFN